MEIVWVCCDRPAAYEKAGQTFHHLPTGTASKTVSLNMVMATQLLIDTDVLIDYLRDYTEQASVRFRSTSPH